MNADSPASSESREQLSQRLNQLQSEYQQILSQGLSLDLTRGKPATAQLDLSDALDGILQGDYRSADGTDCRNYGGGLGIPEARQLAADYLGCKPPQTLVGGNSSLQLMYLTLEFALNTGFRGTGSAWRETGDVSFLCPSPGYDRHFAICEHLGINMIAVPMTDAGPDMDRVEQLVKDDPAIRGIWCVPRFSNPTGCVYSDSTVARMAALPALADRDFLVMWDNAYSVHALTDDAPVLANITEACREQDTLGSVMQFGSTSKITLAGAGIAFMGSSTESLAAFKTHLGYQTIGPDKVNQLRHLRLLPDLAAIEAHMGRHAALIKPKFDCVLEALARELGGSGIGEWTRPQGGYFIAFDTLPGLARTVVSLAAELGVKLTPAGATFPYGDDPEDRNIRLAPTFPSLEDVKTSAEVFALCVKLASVRQLLGD